MVKIDGNVQFICCLLVLYSARAWCSEPLHIQIKDMDGHVIDTVGVGQLFDVCVTIVDPAIRDMAPKIMTDPYIALRWAGKRMERIDKGKMAIQYQYRGYADTTGDYIIGPATVT